MLWLIIIAVALAVLWRTGTWPFDRSYQFGSIKIPKYDQAK